jgi:hypothetical protein
MTFAPRGRLAIGAAAIALLAGAGGTYAASQSSPAPPDPSGERQAFLNDVAKQLNVSPSALTAAIRKAFSDRVDAAVAAGRITKAQGDTIKQRLEQSGGLPPFGPEFGGPQFFGGPEGSTGPEGPMGRCGPMGGCGCHAGPLNAAAQYLGLTDAQLDQALQSGKSLAQVASEHNKSVDGLKQALVGALRSKLDAAVKAKALTSAEEQQMLTRLGGKLDALIAQKGLGSPGDGPGDGPGEGPPGDGPRFGPFRGRRPGPGFFRGAPDGPPPGGPPGAGFVVPGGGPGRQGPGTATS